MARSKFERIRLFAIAGMFASVGAAIAEARTLQEITHDMPTQDVIALHADMDATCSANLTGEIIPACMNRTALSKILEQRGWCQSLLPANYKQWVRCIVGSSHSSGGSFSHGSNPARICMADTERMCVPPVIRSGRYFSNGSETPRSVSPSENR